VSFIHLQVYSAYSLLTSTARVEELARAAKDRGFSAIALTDRNVMYGTIAFYKECLKNNIKPILGLTVDVANAENGSSPLVLLAKNLEGFHNLIKISSVVQTKSPEGIPLKWLRHYTNGLIALTPGKDGEIERLLLQGEKDRARETAEQWGSLFGRENFYLSIQDHSLGIEKSLNEKIFAIGKELGFGLVATNQVHYLNKEDAFAQECLLAIKNGDKLQDDHREKLGSDQYYLKTEAEMVNYISEYPDAMKNSVHIADSCNVVLELGKKQLPKYPVPNGRNAEEFLEEICLSGMKTRFSSSGKEYIDRLKFELDIIKKMKFSDYFLIVWDFMKYARENNILTGPGRGSAAGSLVAYVLQITDVDPIAHNLLFERFLNPERISMPDIDIDFPDHRRDEVIQYVAQKYGELHVAQITTFGTMAAKAALRDTGRAFGLNPKELDQLSKLVPSRLGISLKNAFSESEALQSFVNESPNNQKLFKTASMLEGLPRHTSTHAAGVVISEFPLVEMVPIQKGHGQVYLTQYTMEHLDEVGLLKMDFLGLRNLSLIESILMSIQRKEGRKIDIRSLPLDDEDTYELLARGETTGIFQLESEGMRKVLMRLKPTRFEDIVAVNALYRPGPMENIPLFIGRKHGIDQVEYPHPHLKPILSNTYGVIVYQEQIMQIASIMAGFSLGEADLLRRAVSKKQKETLDREREHFVQGALQKGYDKLLANDIYDLIVKFANYGFNRSHAVAYSLIAYQLAYLKTHYAVHFMAGLLSTAMGNETKTAQYIREARQKEITILPPSVNNSPFSFGAENAAIRFGLGGIKGVGATALKEIFQVRKKKKFDDLFDLCLRVSQKVLNRKTLEALVYSGCLDEFGEDRAVLLASIDVAIEHAQLVNPDDASQLQLFAEEAMMLKPKYVKVDPIRLEDKLNLEKEVLGFYLSDHPVSIYEKELKDKGAIALFGEINKGKRCSAGVYITASKKIRTKKGDSMAFLTISDSSGEMEAVAFPDVYRKFSAVLGQGNLAVIEGKAEERGGELQFIIQRADLLTDWLKSHASSQTVLYLKIIKEMEKPAFLQELKQLLGKYKGNTPVVLYYGGTKTTVRLTKESFVTPGTVFIDLLKDLLGEENVILRD